MSARTAKHGMDLILWRHAEAEDGIPDSRRALTRHGRKQAARMAAWLKPRLPEGCRILASPAVRAQQTAEALELPFETVAAIDVGAAPERVLATVGWPDARHAALVVGHQPTLGQVAAITLSGTDAEWSVRKGAVWWLRSRVHDDAVDVVLEAVVAPDAV